MAAGYGRGGGCAEAASGATGRSTGGGIPAAGLADLRCQWPSEGSGDEAGRLEDSFEMGAVLVPAGVEQIDEILGGKIAGRACARARARSGRPATIAAEWTAWCSC